MDGIVKLRQYSISTFLETSCLLKCHEIKRIVKLLLIFHGATVIK